MPNQCPPAVREQIVLEYRQGRSIRELVNDYEPFEAESDTRLGELEAEELKRLRKDNKQLREDKLILETAAA